MSVKQSNNDEMQNVVINISIENIFSKSLDVITSTGSRQTEKISISKEIPFDIKASINNTHQVYENKVDLSEPCIEVIRGHNSLTSSPEYFVSIPSIKEDETPMMLHGDALSKREDYDPNMHNILAYFKRGHYYKEPFETQRMCNENIHIQEEQKWIHINEFYDESPFNKTSDKIDVKDFVDDIISESMDEAALFSESQELRRKQNLNTLKCSLTDTSADRKRLQRMAMISGLNVQLRDQTKHKQNYLPSTSQSKSKEHKETNNTNTEHSTFDDLLKTEDDQQNSTFRSTLVENENLLKSLILYCSSPSSSQNTHERTISRINSCDFNEVPVNTKETLTSCLTSDSKTEDVTFVSSASLIINDSQCSIKDNSEDEQLLRLVFSSINKNTGTKVTDRSTLIQDHAPVVNSIRTTEQIEEANVGNETVVSKDSRSDNEILEVEIGPEYFVISGNYSVEIGKTDPLGKMLQKLQYGSDIARLDFSITSKLRQLLNQCIKEKIMGIKTSGLNLSLRARTLLESNDPADEIHSQVNVNKYNDKNPQGNVNFCTAENKICGDLLRVHFEKETRLFSWNENMTQYGPAGGYESGKTALRCYIEKFMNASVNESEMVILPSINAAYDMISYCLFESEDVIMTSTPTYARLITSCMERAQCKVVGVELNLERPQLNLTDYERVLNEQKKKGETVRAVILINPHNPLGVVFPKDDVVKLCEWASRKNLSVLVDESFCQCVHGTNFFRSFLTYRNQIESSNNVIYMWSLSKDFGLPGAKVSMIYSSNTPLIRSLSRLELIHPVSTIAQEFTVKLLSDFDWLHSFHVEKLNRLRAHYHFTTANLRHLDLPFVNSEAGIFVLVDFRKHLTSCTHTEELHLWKRMTDNGLFLSPGFHMLCHQPGWMRIVFSCTKDELIEGFVRLHRMFGRSSSVVGTIRY